MCGNRFVRLLVIGSLLTIAACANSGRVEPKSTETHTNQPIPMNSGDGGGGGY
jgi:hypothetical protein